MATGTERGVAPLAVLGESFDDSSDAGGHVPHVVAWNLTRRCNLECAHCYIAAGPTAAGGDELRTDECLRIADEILAVNPASMFILSGGEPLLRADLATIARHSAGRGATVVVGTNGTLLTTAKIDELRDAGVTGVAVSIESLDPTYHDRFRRGHGSLDATLAAVERLAARGLDFVIQTTITKHNRSDLTPLVEWAAERGAVSFNAYFLVATGRGAGMSDLDADGYESALTELVDLHVRFLGTMMVRAKCAPQFMRLVHQRAPDSPVLHYSTRCPCGVQYCRVTPDGKLTACPYLPVPAGDLRTSSFGELWRSSQLFRELRSGTLDGKCGRCEYRQVCGGCRARGYATEGNYLAADPSCAYEPPGDRPLVQRARPTSYGDATRMTLTWTVDATARMRRIPSFVRAVVVQRVEDYARLQGRTEITLDVLADVRRTMPVDFSRRRPFFLRDDA